MRSVTLNNNKLEPSKVVCIGRNYVEHIKELNNDFPSEPVIFVKPNSAICDQIVSSEKDEIHYEAELSFIVKNSKITAVGLGLDLTKRVVQSALKEKGLPWERAKAFDNSAVFSGFVEMQSITDLRLELWINGKLQQTGDIDLMIYKPSQIISNVSEFMSFEDGDILMTGTPKGVGKIQKGDIFIGKVFDQKKNLINKTWTVK